MLGSTDKVEILALDLVHHCVHLGKTHDAVDDCAADHEGRNEVGEALADHEVTRVGEHRRVKPCNIPGEIVEAVARDASGRIEIDSVKTFHDLGVIGDLEIRNDRIAVLRDLDVLGVVLSDRNLVGDYLRNGHHVLLHDGVGLGLDGIQLLYSCGACGNLCLNLLDLGGKRCGLISFALLLRGLHAAHQPADLLGELVALASYGVRLGLGGSRLGVLLDDLVDHRELRILEFLADVLADRLRILTQELNVDHDFSSPVSS